MKRLQLRAHIGTKQQLTRGCPDAADVASLFKATPALTPILLILQQRPRAEQCAMHEPQIGLVTVRIGVQTRTHRQRVKETRDAHHGADRRSAQRENAARRTRRPGNERTWRPESARQIQQLQKWLKTRRRGIATRTQCAPFVGQ
jgi:hypothetical protein